MLYGLTQLEAEKFLSLVDMLRIPDEDRQLYEDELCTEDPFAGVLSDTESLIALKLARDLDITLDSEINEVWKEL